MNRVPTLIVGVGGIGGKVVSDVFSAISDEDKQYIAAVCLDTNTNDLSKLEGKVKYIQTSEKMLVSEYLEDRPEAMQWYPDNPYLFNRVLTAGAGQVRANSRLAFEAAVNAGRLSVLHRAIDSINRVDGSSLQESLRVMVICSIAGGTGAGIFIQLPFYIKQYLRSINIQNLIVRGLFLSPDIVRDIQEDKYNEQAVLVNGYSCLKELNAFYGAQTKSSDEVIFELPFYRKDFRTPDMAAYGYGDDSVRLNNVNDIPYDHAFILERVTRSGKNIGGLESYIRMARDIVRMQLFSPLSGDIFSIEDNKIIAIIRNNGRSRFGSAAVSRAVYPYEKIRDYCAMRWAVDSVSQEWTVIDEAFAIDHAMREDNRATDPTLPELTRSEHYIEKFRSIITSTSAPDFFTALRKEVQKPVRSEISGSVTYRNADEEFVSRVESYLSDVVSTEEIEAARQECEIRSDQIKGPQDDASQEMRRIYNAISNYEDVIESTIKSKVFSAIDTIIPAHERLNTSASECDIASVIRDVHPMSARYLLYKIRDKLRALSSEAKDMLDSCEKRLLFNKDFDRDTGGSQTAYQAVSNKSPSFMYPYIKLGSGAYIKILNEFINIANQQRENLATYCQAKFSHKVYTEIIKRLDSIIELYEQFFDNIPKIITDKQKEIDKLYTYHNNEYDHSVRYIFADSRAKDILYERVKDGMYLSSKSLDDSVKQGLFDEIYRVFATGLRVSRSMNKEEREMMKNGVSMRMREVFDNSVMENLISLVADKGDKIINLDILKAIEEQIILDRPAGAKRDVYGKIIPVKKTEAAQILADVMNRADPFLSYRSTDTDDIMCFWGINRALIPDANDNSGKPDMVMAENLFDIGNGRTGTPVVDSEFDIHELICYQGLYNIRSDALKNFNADSEARKFYDERVSVILGLSKGDDDVDYYKARVCPHIDSRWVEPAYIPPFSEAEERSLRREQRLAFLLSLALNRCMIADLDKSRKWIYVHRSMIKYNCITVNGEIIPTTYKALYDSFLYNSRMIADVLDHAEFVKKTEIQKSKDNMSVDNFFKHSIIRALLGESFDQTGPDAGGVAEPDFSSAEDMEDGLHRENALAVIYSLYRQTGGTDVDLLSSMLETLSKYIWAYCFDLIGAPVGTAEAYKSIMDKMYERSGIDSLGSDQLADIDKAMFRNLSQRTF